MDVTAFLLARIAEDETIARAAEPGPWTAGATTRDAWHPADDACPADAAHIARFDPARVLAECEAKRKLVELHAPTEEHARFSEFGVQCAECSDHYYGGGYPCETLEIIALPYRNHPDFDPAWAVA